MGNDYPIETVYNVYDWKVVLGRGAFATVFQAKDIKSGKNIAIKRINKSYMDAVKLKRVQLEIKVQYELKHPSILKLYSHFEDDYFIYLVLELCLKGDLQAYLEKRGKPFAENEARKIFRQVVEGTSYMHSKNIMHRDLKLANILLAEEGNVKIADFGLATPVEESHRTMCGTPNFMPPEASNQPSNGFKHDIWSLGCILYALVVGCPPFEGITTAETFDNIKTSPLYLPSTLSDELAHLIKALLRKEPMHRMTAESILEHPFMTQRSIVTLQSQNWPGSYKSLDRDSGTSTMSDSVLSSNLSTQRSHSTSSIGFGSGDSMLSGSRFHESEAIYGPTGADHYPRIRPSANPICGKSLPVRLERNKTKSHAFRGLKEKFSAFQPQSSLPSYVDMSLPVHDVLPLTGLEINVAKSVRQVQNAPSSLSLQDSNYYSDRDGHDVCHQQSNLCPHNSNLSQCSSCNGLAMDKKPCCSQCTDVQSCSCAHCPKYKSQFCSPIREGNRCRSSSPSRSCCSGACEGSCCSSHHKSPSCSHLGSCDKAHCIHAEHCYCKSGHKPSPNAHCGCSHRDQSPHTQECHSRLPPTTENAKAGKKLLQDLAQPLNTLRLPPMRQKANNAVITICPDGEVCFEIFKPSNQKYVVLEVYRISGNGLHIKVYRPDKEHAMLGNDPPPLPKLGNYEVYSYETLPPKHWKKYVYAAQFIKLVQAKTPKLVFHSSLAKNSLMENGTDFESTFLKGGKISKTSTSTKIIDHCGRATFVKGEDEVRKLGEDMVAMWKHFLMAEKQCRALEAAIDVMERESGEVFYPVYMGKHREIGKNSNALKDSNKENISHLNPSPMVSGMASYDSTIINLNSNISEVISNKVPLERSNPSNQLEKSHPQRGSTALVLSNSRKKDTPLKTKGVSKTETGAQLVEFSDGTHVTLGKNMYCYIDENGKLTRYRPDSRKIPVEIKSKVDLAIYAIEHDNK